MAVAAKEVTEIGGGKKEVEDLKDVIAKEVLQLKRKSMDIQNEGNYTLFFIFIIIIFKVSFLLY